MSHLANRDCWSSNFSWLVLSLMVFFGSTSFAQTEAIEQVTSVSLPTLEVAEYLDGQILQRLELEQAIPAGPCEDHEFIRRLYLDLTGQIPSVAQLDQFLADTSPDKRERLIEELLASDAHFEYFATIFDTMLMGRKERKLGERKKHGWHAYLRRVFAENRPWDQVVQEVLLARAEGEQRGHLWYLYERENNHQEIAEAVAKSFFGVDIACAQCHDHLAAEEIKQAHYWGLVGFFRRSTNAQSDQGIAIAESAIGGFDDYANPLLGTTEKLTLSFLLREDVPEPRPEDPAKQEDHESLYVAVAGEPKIPVFSRRERFVEEIVKDHPLIARAMVNRIWGLLLGRGLVHPIERMDSTQAPSHPELLDWLSDDFRRNGYNVQRMVREVVRSQTYQRASSKGSSAGADHLFGSAIARPLTAEAYLKSLQVALPFPQEVVDSENWQRLAAQWRRFFPEIVPTTDQATIDQALGLANSPEFNAVLQAAAEQWVAETESLETEQRIQLAYRRVYGRLPETDELSMIHAYLARRADRPVPAWAQVFWTLVTSAEFRYNH
jgi:hypothetical protein